MADPIEDVKAGRVLSKANMDRIMSAMSALQEALSSAMPKMDEDDAEVLSLAPTAIDAVLVSHGEAVKALGDGRVGGYLVRFSTESDPDISSARDFFTKDTDFLTSFPATSPAWFHHALNVKKQRLSHDAELRLDDLGVWAETILDERDQYEKFLLDLAEKGKLGWSSGTASHLVEREPVGDAHRIKRWPLGLDASLTHTPAEPRNSVIPLKSISDDLPLEPETPQAGAEAEPARRDGPEAKADNLTPLAVLEEPEMGDITITDEQLQGYLEAAASKGAEAALKSLPAAQPAANVTVVKDEADQEFGSNGEFLKAVKNAALYPNAEDPRLRPLKATGLSEGIPADGGYLLNPQMAAGINEHMLEAGTILSRVASDTVSGNTMLYNGVDETSRASSLYGGIVGYWLAEAGTITGSKPAFYQTELKLKKIAALCYATDEQLEDTAALGSWLTRTVPNALRWYVEEAIINGNGVGKPLGILSAPALVTVARDTASKVYLADIAEMWSRRYQGVSDYVWLCGPDVVAQLQQMTAATAPIYLPPGGVSAAPYGSIYGRPVIETDHCQALNTKGDLILASLSQYQTITKAAGVQSATSIHVAFTTAEQAFRFIYRIDGQPLWHSALTPAHGSNTVSPFVTLSSATTP